LKPFRWNRGTLPARRKKSTFPRPTEPSAATPRPPYYIKLLTFPSLVSLIAKLQFFTTCGKRTSGRLFSLLCICFNPESRSNYKFCTPKHLKFKVFHNHSAGYGPKLFRSESRHADSSAIGRASRAQRLSSWTSWIWGFVQQLEYPLVWALALMDAVL
jgi:hypothetical protein